MGSAKIANALGGMRAYRDSLMLKPLTADNKIAIADATLEIDRLEEELMTAQAKTNLLHEVSIQKVPENVRQKAKEKLGNWFKDGFAAALIKQNIAVPELIEAAPIPDGMKEEILQKVNIIDHTKLFPNEAEQNGIDDTMKWLQDWKKDKSQQTANKSKAKALAIEKKKAAEAAKWMDTPKAVLTQPVVKASEPKKRRILIGAKTGSGDSR